MGLRERLEVEMKEAMRQKQGLRLSAIRMLRAAAQNKEIDQGRPLSDNELLPVIRTMVKQRRESIEAFEKGGRTELADRERDELEILAAYLPPAPSDEEVAKVIREVVGETGAEGPKQMGIVMKECMDRLGGAADGKQVSTLVRKALTPAKD